MKLATTIGEMDGYCQTEEEAVRAYEGTGFRHLDYSFYRSNYPGSPFMGKDWMKSITDAAKTAERLGFDFVQAHSPGNDWFGRDDEQTVTEGNLRAIEACGYLGIKNLVVHSGRCNDYLYPRDWQEYLQQIRRFYETLYPAMEKYGVNVLAENYIPGGPGVCSLYRAGDLLELLEVCSHPQLGICWDVGHGNLIEPDKQYEQITALGTHLKAVHIQDNFGYHDDHICPLVGTLDVDGVMRGLKDNGFIDRGGVFTFEADNLISHRHSWPNARHENGAVVAAEPTLAVKQAAVRMLYEIGKSILTQYDCFED